MYQNTDFFKFEKNQYSGTFIKTLKKIRVDSLQRAREGGGIEGESVY